MPAPDHFSQPLSEDPASPAVLVGRPTAGPYGLQVYPLLVVVRRGFVDDVDDGATGAVERETVPAGRWLAIGEVHMRKSWPSAQVASLHGAPREAWLPINLAASRLVGLWREQKQKEQSLHERADFLRATMRAKSDQIAKLQAENAAHADDLQQVISDLPADPATYNDRQRDT